MQSAKFVRKDEYVRLANERSFMVEHGHLTTPYLVLAYALQQEQRNTTPSDCVPDVAGP